MKIYHAPFKRNNFTKLLFLKQNTLNNINLGFNNQLQCKSYFYLEINYFNQKNPN